MDINEKYIIETISNHREAVDTDALWASIAEDIPQKKKRRGVIWFWFGISVFGLLGGLGLALNSHSTKLASTELPVQIRKTQFAEVTELPSVNIGMDNIEVADIIESKPVIVSKSQVKVDGKVTGNEFKPRMQKKNANKEIAARIENADMSRKYITQLSTDDKFVEESNSIKEASPLGNTNKVSTKVSQALNNREELKYATLELNGLELFEYSKSLMRPSLLSLPYVDLTKNRNRKWSLFVGGGVSAASRNLTAIDDEYTDIVNRRNEIEEVLGGWQLSAGVGYQLSPSFDLSLGLGVNQIHERATFNSNYTVETVNEGTVIIIHNQDGTTTNVTGTTTNLANRSTFEIRNNKLRQYSIPLSIRYRLLENENYKLSINGGFAYLFYQTYEGYTSIDAEQRAYSIGEDQLGLFDFSSNVSFGVGADISKSISPNINLVLGVSYRNFGRNTNVQTPIEQKYKTFAITFGMHQLL